MSYHRPKGPIHDLTGRPYGRLTVLGLSTYRGNSKKGETFWICECDCGEIIDVRGTDLKKNHTKSCGCFRRENTGALNRTHGLTNTRTYSIWLGILQRCNNVNNPDYHHYGGRGITVDPSWLVFEQFLSDMGEAPDSMTLDRRDNNLGYNKANCRWVTKIVQANNTRANRYVTYEGVTKTVAQWERHFGYSNGIIRGRLHLGWSEEDALTTPMKKRSR